MANLDAQIAMHKTTDLLGAPLLIKLLLQKNNALKYHLFWLDACLFAPIIGKLL
jgi:hypothetical protein